MARGGAVPGEEHLCGGQVGYFNGDFYEWRLRLGGMGGSFGRPLPSPLPSVGGAGTTSISRASLDKGFIGKWPRQQGVQWPRLHDRWQVDHHRGYSNKGFIDHKGTLGMFGKGTTVIFELLFVDYNFLHGVH